MYAMTYRVTYKPRREADVQRLNPARDIQPVSEFRSNAAKFIDQVRQTKEPVIITQHGRGAAVLVDVDSYQDLLERIELLTALLEGLESERKGKTRAHVDVVKELRAMPTR